MVSTAPPSTRGPSSQSGPPSARTSWRAPPPPATARALGTLTAFFSQLGEVATLAARCVRALFRKPFEGREIVRQLESLGVASMGIVTVTSLFIGMVMSTQFAFGLQKFGGMEYTGRVVALTFARELAPTLTAVIVGGRIGAGMTAELGAMAVTEQLDAISALGADPVKKLVLPRLIASIFVLPIVGTFALILGFTGAMVITDSQFGIPAAFFFQSALDQLVLMDYLMGLVKTPVFGIIIALLGCHFGMRTRGGTAGVGSSTTKTVVAISITILIADFFLTKLVFVFWNVF
ncbi:MAG TPA: ABC transporter permease [Polyangiaceae bacterium]|nr:ABC transporter permease [Polyangiaceae bacterium]